MEDFKESWAFDWIARSFQTIYMKSYNNDSKNDQTDATVFHHLKIGWYTSPIVFKVFCDISWEPIPNSHFLKSTAAWAFSPFNVVLSWTGAFDMEFCKSHIGRPFQRFIFIIKALFIVLHFRLVNNYRNIYKINPTIYG